MKKKKQQRSDFYSFYASETAQDGEQRQFKTAKKRSPLIRIGLALFVGVLAASAWFGYLFFSERLGGGSSDPLTVTVEGPSSSENGALAEYTIEYYHRGSAPVNDVALFAEYPIGFTFVQSDPAPENSKKNFWNIGTLQPGQKGTITVAGTVTGFDAEERVAVFSLQYLHPTYRSSFTLEKKIITRISPARAERLGIAGPPTINAGAAGAFTVRYQDVSRLGNPENVILKLTLPEGLSLEESEPALSDSEKKEWNGFALSKTVRPDLEGGVLSFSLKATPELQGPLEIHAQLVLRDSDGQDASLLSARHQVMVLRSDLTFSLKASNGEALTAVALGEALAADLEIENKGNCTFQNVEVRLESASAALDREQSVFVGGEQHDMIVVWSPEKNEQLKEIKSGEKKSIPLKLVFHPVGKLSAEERAKPIDLALDARIAERVENDGTLNGEPLDVPGPRLALSVISDALVSAFVKDVSSPLSGKRTYRVYYGVTNSLHDLEELDVSAHLPDGIEWVGVNSRSAGDIAYSSSDRTVRWWLNALPFSVGRIDGSYDIIVSSDQGSTETVLVKDVVFRARDRNVGVSIEQKIDALTTLSRAEND